jgi:hypothetical protein
MAVTQISRIQHRRGLEQDLPTLAGAELGWSVDTRKLYIGNGTLEEGAPTLGVTEILTQYSDLTALLGSYTFVGNVTGYTVQTGSSVLNPVVRSFQQKFDDFVNVRDFGATGDGSTDDTTAINRAIQQIYIEAENLNDPRTRRTIYIPGGTYLTSNVISIPPNARLVGDGVNSTTIKLQYGNLSVANTCDSAFQSGGTIGSGGATLPDSIDISGIRFYNSAADVTRPILNIDSASNVRITNSAFVSNNFANVVEVLSTSTSTHNVTLDGVQILGGGNGFVNMGTTTKAINVLNSQFDDLSNTAVVLNGVNSYSSINNYFGTVGTISKTAGATNFVSLGEIYSTGSATLTGAYLGNLNLGHARSSEISTDAPVIASFVADTAGEIKYEVSNSSARRFGTMTFSTDGTDMVFNDNYSETVTSVKANVYANGTSLTCSLDSGTGVFKYSINQFIS